MRRLVAAAMLVAWAHTPAAAAPPIRFAETVERPAGAVQRAWAQGRVALAVVYVDSYGQYDYYSWTDAKKGETLSAIQAAQAWWQAEGSRFNAALTLDVYTYHAWTQWEPILYPQGEFVNWIPDALANLGYSGDYATAMSAFSNSLISSTGADGAAVVFVVYGGWDAPTSFTDGKWAFALPDGLVILGQETSLAEVVTHELGHVFGACDEYNEPGYGGCADQGGCNCSLSSYETANPFCEACTSGEHPPCMMKDLTEHLCPYTRAQIGWFNTAPSGAPEVRQEGDALVAVAYDEDGDLLYYGVELYSASGDELLDQQILVEPAAGAGVAWSIGIPPEGARFRARATDVMDLGDWSVSIEVAPETSGGDSDTDDPITEDAGDGGGCAAAPAAQPRSLALLFLAAFYALRRRRRR